MYSWIRLTLWRAPRTRLVLTLFGALVLAFPATALMVAYGPRTQQENSLLLEIARLSVPVTAVLVVTALRMAMRAPVATAGAWVFRVIHGRPDERHAAGVRAWVLVCSCGSSLMMIAAMLVLLPVGLRGGMGVVTQLSLAFMLPLLSTDLLFLRETSIPFTEQRATSVDDLSISVSAFLVLIPLLTFALVAAEPWMEARWIHLAGVIGAGVVLDQLIRLEQVRRRRVPPGESDMDDEALLPGELGIRSHAG